MLMRCGFLMLALVLLGTTGQEHINPIYQQLRKEGVAATAQHHLPLPPPLMADGLTAPQQKAVIDKLIENNYPWEVFVRPSLVSPQILHISDPLQPSDPKAPARRVDTYFVAYGDLAAIANKPFLDRLLQSNEKSGRGHDLTAAELQQRGITVRADQANHEGFGHASFEFLKMVQIDATGHSYWSQSADSILLATQVDPRFRQDAQFPNQWRSLTRDNSGRLQAGPPHSYEGVGYYMKITRLHNPPGALFVESHVLFTEPYGWFEGRNLLRSKLPPVVQDKVRSMRREMFKTLKGR